MRICLLILWPLTIYAASAQTVQTLSRQPPDCSQPPTSCAKPVKWLATKKNCSCFACEYGKPAQHTICTSNKEVKLALLTLSRSDGNLVATGPVRDLSGKIALQGGKATLTDETGRTWNILNSDLVSDYAGENIQLKARVDEKKNEIVVMTFKAPEHKD